MNVHILPEQRVGAALREARKARGVSLREMARRLNYHSHSTLSEYEMGTRMPSEAVVEGYERVLNVPRGTLTAVLESANIERHGDAWMKRRLHFPAQYVRGSNMELAAPVGGSTVGALTGIPSTPNAAAPPWPPEPVVDGADPDAAGCSVDAITVHSRRVAYSDRRVVVGHIELRYSHRALAAWGRFKGYRFLDHLAVQHQDVQIAIDVLRLSDGTCVPLCESYCFDFMWGNLVVADGGLFKARVRVLVCKEDVAHGATDAVRLPAS